MSLLHKSLITNFMKKSNCYNGAKTWNNLYSELPTIRACSYESYEPGWAGIINRADLEVARSRVVYCFSYMFLRFDSHENRVCPVFRAPV